MRPSLNKNISINEFRSYYFLKAELVSFCKENNIPSNGNKKELTERIAFYLKNGFVLVNDKPKIKKTYLDIITNETLIGDNIVFSENLRSFFKEKIGNGFSFNVPFQKWLKENPDKTIGEAIQAYYHLLKIKKSTKTSIGTQFEYNTYIRDFLIDNKGKSLKEAIKCWNYKKSLPGHNFYEKADLVALK